MTLLNAIVGDDRVVLVQDSGGFDPDTLAPVCLVSKVVALPHAATLLAGSGDGQVLTGWQAASFATRAAGACFEELAEYAQLHLSVRGRSPTQPTTALLLGLDRTGRGAGCMLCSPHYTPQWLRPGEWVFAPATREPVEAAPAPDDVPPAATPTLAGPAEPASSPPADWTFLQIELRRTVRLQCQQSRAPWSPPIFWTELRAGRIEVREFRP